MSPEICFWGSVLEQGCLQAHCLTLSGRAVPLPGSESRCRLQSCVCSIGSSQLSLAKRTGQLLVGKDEHAGSYWLTGTLPLYWTTCFQFESVSLGMPQLRWCTSLCPVRPHFLLDSFFPICVWGGPNLNSLGSMLASMLMPAPATKAEKQNCMQDCVNHK